MIPPLVFALFNLTTQDETFGGGFLTNILYSIGPTISLTTGCTLLINFLQKRLPWGKTPLRRLAIELMAIIAMSVLVAFIFTCANPFVSENTSVKGLLVTNLVFNVGITLFIVTIVEAAFFFNQWKQTRIEREQLEKEHYKAQFQNLKNQINPHLLFNSLNALTGLIESNTEKAVSYVQDLSRYLRMVLSHTSSEAISVEEELSLLRHYYNLQNARFGNSFRLTIQIPEEVRRMLIPPLSLQMLVENAVKHNVISRSSPLEVKVSYKPTDLIEVSNRKVKKQTYEDSTGVGLENIKERYQLLGEHHIRVEDSDEYFKVSIPLLNLEDNATGNNN